MTRQTGIVQIKSGNEKELQAAVATGGPVAVAIDGSSNAFRVNAAILCCNFFPLSVVL